MLSGLLLILAAYAAVFAGAELLLRRGWSPLLARKSAHAAGGLVSCALPALVTQAAAVSIGAGLSLMLAAASRRRALPAVHAGGTAAGAALFPAGLALSALLFWNSGVFVWSALLLALADAAAGAGGGLWGRRKYSLTGPKTLEGSAIFFAVALCITLAFVYSGRGGLDAAGAAAAAAGALALTLVESALGRGWDNVGVPLAGGAVLLLLR